MLRDEDDWSGLNTYRHASVLWRRAGILDAPIEYRAEHAGQEWLVRMNDFPDEPLFTLIVDGVEIVNFNEWPREWGEPPP